MPGPPGLTLDETLDVYRAAMHELQADPTRGGPAIGVADWDVRLYRLGQVAARRPRPSARRAASQWTLPAGLPGVAPL